MICPKCGSNNPEGATFCQTCACDLKSVSSVQVSQTQLETPTVETPVVQPVNEVPVQPVSVEPVQNVQPQQEQTNLPKNNNKKPILIIAIILIVVLGIGGFLFFKNSKSNISGNNKRNQSNQATNNSKKSYSEEQQKELAKQIAVDWVDTFISFNEYCDSVYKENETDEYEYLKLVEKAISEKIKPKLDSSSVYLAGKTYSIRKIDDIEISGYHQFLMTLYPWNKRYTVDDVDRVEIFHQDTTNSDIAAVYFKGLRKEGVVTVNLDEKKINATSLNKDSINYGSYRAVVILDKGASLKVNNVDIKNYYSKWSYEGVVKEYATPVFSNQTLDLSIDLTKYGNGNYEFYCIPLVYIPFEYEYSKGNIKRTVTLKDFEEIGNVVKYTLTTGEMSLSNDYNLIVMTEEYMK